MKTTAMLIIAISFAGILLVGGSVSTAASTATCLGERATIVGTDGDDMITGTNDDDVIVALGGNDMISARDGDDLVCAGDGNDRIDGGDGFVDGIDGGPGDDSIDGADAALTFAIYDEAPGPVNVSLEAGTATGYGNDTFVDVNAVSGSAFDDTIVGDRHLNFLMGGEGNDHIVGGASMDLLSGDGGDDTVDGSSGSDVITYYDSPHGVAVNIGTGVASGWGKDRVSHIENVDGSKYADRLTGTWNVNEIDGNGGADRMVGLGSNDVLLGGAGRDYADGGKGRDRCSAERRVRCP